MSSKDVCKFVRLNASYANAIARLEAVCFDLPWNETQIAKALSGKFFAAFALQGKNCQHTQSFLIAYILVYHTDCELEIVNIGVHPQYRGQGYGKELLRNVLRWAKKKGMLQSVLEVRPSNKAALCMYSSLGYNLVGKRLGYYRDTGEDALIYIMNFESDC